MGHLSQLQRQGRGPRPRRSAQRRGPLRRIVAVLSRSSGLFDADLVRLECGHSERSNGTYRARCAACGKPAQA